MAEDFYPFVENGQGDASTPLEPHHPARIAVYDDASAAPRVVIIEPKDVRSYLEEITLQVTQLSQAQGGTIPFMVIREIVENLIHAYFIEPTVSILNHGNTIRFSDQGPGIREKALALQYGTTSASEEMRRYIRGVGSGLPYVRQYMYDKGGSLHIEDNLAGGTVVTISAAANQSGGMPMTPQYQQSGAQATPPQPQAQPYGWGQPSQGQAWPTWQQGAQQPWPPQPQQDPRSWTQQGPMPPYGMSPYPTAPYASVQPGGAQPNAMPPTQGPQPYGPPQDAASASGPSSNAEFSWVHLSERGTQALDYLREHEAVGPSDLARTYGGSQPTWTRELKALEDQGLILKDGQKRRLTAMGRAYLQHA